MRTLYVFPTSPFSRRTRLALAQKSLDVELKDARADATFRAEAKKLWPLRTIPVFVDEGGHAVGDSTAIAHYLDARYPASPRTWPTDPTALRAALEIAALVDGALNTIIDVGTRYYALSSDAAWPKVQDELLGRAQGALDRLSERAVARGAKTLTDAGWCAADRWLFTMVAWVEGFPERAPTNPNIAQILTLPWSLPAPLVAWAAPFHERADVKALG
jgi:glutathione S-transferase